MVLAALRPVPRRSSVATALGLVYVIWGSTYLAIRVAVDTLQPFFSASIRFLVSGAVLFAFLRWRGVPAPRGVEWRSCAVVGVFLLLGGNGAVVWGEQSVPSGLAALLVSVMPLWLALADWVRPGGRKPRTQVAVGLLIGFAGLVVLAGPDLTGVDVRFSAGLIALLIAAPLWAIGSIYARSAPMPSSPFMATACEMLAGGAALAVASVVAGEPARLDLASVTPASWGALAYLIVFGSMLGFTAYIWLLKNVALPVASTYAYVNPVVAVVLGWLILDEPIGMRTAAAGAMVLAAVALITLTPRAPAGDPAAGEA